jgi:hypothetical protein
MYLINRSERVPCCVIADETAEPTTEAGSQQHGSTGCWCLYVTPECTMRDVAQTITNDVLFTR